MRLILEILRYCQLHYYGKTFSVKFESKYKHCHWKSLIWKCCLQKGGHFVLASVCKLHCKCTWVVSLTYLPITFRDVFVTFGKWNNQQLHGTKLFPSSIKQDGYDPSGLTRSLLGDFDEILENKFSSHNFSNWWLRYLLWYYPQMNVTGLNWW